MTDPGRTQAMPGPGFDPNKTQMGAPPTFDPNKTIMGNAPSAGLNMTVTIVPVQCPVCKSMNPPGLVYCGDCGLIFEMALDGDAFGAPAVQVPVLVDSSGREHKLRPGITTIGRMGDILIEDTRVSRQHAKVTLGSDGASIEDLGSTNGTKVGDTRISAPTQLRQGDKISLGGFEMTFSMPGETNKTLAAMSGRTAAISAAPTTSTAVAWLSINGEEQPLEIGVHPFGRRSENDIVISDPYVSGKHGEFEASESGVFVTDTGSTNGTFLNDAKLAPNQKTQLRATDVIRLGSIEIKVRFKE